MQTAKLKVFNLGVELDVNSIYSDFPISKRELASILQCSRTSIHKWCDIAWSISKDFRNEYPQDEDGEFLKDAPLAPYQVWLISRIKSLMERLKSQERAKDYINRNAGLFCLQRFQSVVNVIKEKTA